MKQEDRDLLVRALAFALGAHGDQTRKGKPIPYASHLLQVAGLVLEHGGSATLAAAGLLHDAAEDCDDVDLDLIRQEFGPELARIVEVCTDTLPGDSADTKSPWLDRKLRYLDQVAEADGDAKLVVACDKLHNLRSIVADLDAEGVETLDRFTATRGQTRWYFEAIREHLSHGVPPSLIAEIDEELEALRGYIDEASREP